MAHYSRLSRKDIEAISADFDLHPISSFKVLSGGWENTNYLVEAGNGRYVLTLCEQKTPEQARDLVFVLEHLERNHFETSRVKRSIKNEPFILLGGKPIIMKKFVEGKILKELPPPLIELAGRELGRLHKIEAPEYLPRKLSYGREQFEKVEKYAANTGFERWLRKKLEYFSPYLSPDLPRAFIHGDVFCDNVIVSKNERSLAILDFEESAFYYRIFDIGMMIIGTCSEGQAVNFKKAGALLKGYLQEIPLLEEEFNALHAFIVYAGAAMTFWRHRNFNYTRPDSRLADHYLGLKVLTDFVEQQDAGDFLNRVLP